MKNLRIWLAFALAALLSACATQTFAPDTAPEYVTIQPTPFFHLGPVQANGPDQILLVNTRVKLLRKEMGFSLIQISTGWTGYVANENMAPAPPLPKPKPDADADPTPGKRGKSSGIDSPTYHGEQINDTPLPDGPKPDLNIAPEEVPTATPSPTPAKEAPKFRT